MNNNISLGDRMKEYEKTTKQYLDNNKPAIIRLDGKAFHTFTKRFKRPFDDKFMDLMDQTAIELCKNIQGAKVAYVQSDEITIVLECTNNYSQFWYNGSIQKITSVSASIATAIFNKLLFIELAFNQGYTLEEITNTETAKFDSRVNNVDNIDEVTNNIIWRQRDCIKNSISVLAQSNFSNKQLHKKNGDEKKQMLLNIGIDWDALDNKYKNGRLIHKINLQIKNIEQQSYYRITWISTGINKIKPNSYLYDKK